MEIVQVFEPGDYVTLDKEYLRHSKLNHTNELCNYKFMVVKSLTVGRGTSDIIYYKIRLIKKMDDRSEIPQGDFIFSNKALIPAGVLHIKIYRYRRILETNLTNFYVTEDRTEG